jgi:hypothetical protein
MHVPTPSRKGAIIVTGLGGMALLALLAIMGVTVVSSTTGGRHEHHLFGYGSVGSGSSATPGVTRTPGVVTGALRTSFTISGNITGLYPGSTLPLKLTVLNTMSFAIRVTSITTAVSNASNLCEASNVTVTSFSGSLLVLPKLEATTTVQVHMADGAPDSCQGSVFPFSYSGLASKA